MKVKCNAIRCESNVEGNCDLREINLNFSDDYESYGCYCGNFKESKEYKKSTYKLTKLDKNLYLAIRTNVFDDVDMEMVIEEINPKQNIEIIIDNLLYIGSPKADNRFITISYDVKMRDLYSNYKIGKPLDEYIDIVKKYTCDYIRETGNEGCVYSTAFKMIMKGINL